MLTRIHDFVPSQVFPSFNADRTRLQFLGLTLYQTITEANRRGRRVWLLGVPVFHSYRDY